MTTTWEIVVFVVEGKPNHVGLSVPERGLADLSLLGARIIPWDGERMPKGERAFFQVDLENPEAALVFLSQPGLLCGPIRAQERASRGWHLTPNAPDYVRKLRQKRSRDPRDMNCVEWIVHALELGGVALPDDVLTPTDLYRWCENNCEPSS